MPVPASFNDITQNSTLREYIGWVWYDRQVWVPTSWLDGSKRIMLRFESAHYNTIVVGMYVISIGYSDGPLSSDMALNFKAQ